MTARAATQAWMEKGGMAFARLKALWGKTPGGRMRPLYAALVAEARDPPIPSRGPDSALLPATASVLTSGRGDGADTAAVSVFLPKHSPTRPTTT